MAAMVAIGIDTHKRTHTAVALDELGRELGSREIAATSAGYLRLWRWAERLGEASFAIEGTGSYGAGLTGFLSACGAEVYECERPSRRDRRRGKSDLVDAAAAVRRLLAGEGLSRPRGTGPREDLRALLLERRGVARARTAALNQLHGLLLNAPASLRERLDGIRGERLAQALRRLHGRADERGTGLQVLRRIARRVTQLSSELAEVDEELQRLTAALVPELLAEVGVGPVAAAQLLVSSGDPARMRSEAAFAALAGTSPIDASSGQQRRHRLNRGGDRQLNYALHLIASNRVRYHPQTSAYYTHLIARGKTKREALRCVKRALARYFYRQLQKAQPLTP